MSLILKDTLGNTLTLDAVFRIPNYSFKRRQRSIEIAYNDGAKAVSDFKLSARTIQIEGRIRGATEADYFTAKDALLLWLQKQDLKLYVKTGLYINVKTIYEIAIPFYDGGFHRISKISFTCYCEDPFFYSDTLNDLTATLTGSGSFSITNPASYDAYPLLTITNSALNVSLKLTNITDDNRYFDYIDAGFLNAYSLVVDNALGSVKMQGANSIDKFAGNFLRLLPGVNSFDYVGAACQVNFKFYDKSL